MRMHKLPEKSRNKTLNPRTPLRINLSKPQHLLHKAYRMLRQASRLAKETIESRVRDMGDEGNQSGGPREDKYSDIEAAGIAW